MDRIDSSKSGVNKHILMEYSHPIPMHDDKDEMIFNTRVLNEVIGILSN
jgi:hypothetical protein